MDGATTLFDMIAEVKDMVIRSSLAQTFLCHTVDLESLESTEDSYLHL